MKRRLPTGWGPGAPAAGVDPLRAAEQAEHARELLAARLADEQAHLTLIVLGDRRAAEAALPPGAIVRAHETMGAAE